MKKIFFYIVATLLFVACSSEDIQKNPPIINPTNGTSNIPDNICCAIMPVIGTDPEVNNTRSTLYYDYTTGGTSFKWFIDEVNPETGSDKIGVFPENINPENSTVQPFKIDEYFDDLGTVGTFGKLREGDGYQTFANNLYMAYFPYVASESFNYTNIPVDYRDQKQNGIPKIYYYRYRNSPAGGQTTDDYINTYVESEKEACTHLPEKDYLVANTRPAISGNLHFNMKRLSAIIRFYIVVPAKLVYDKIQVFNPNAEKPFVLETTMDAKQLKFADTPTSTSSSISLQLGDAGFDLSEDNVNLQYYKYSESIPVVLTAYMMAAPVDLSGSDDKQCILYLHSNSDNPALHKVYKATLAKKNLKENFLNQWSVSGMSEEEPITLSAIEVQQWVDETKIDNENGNGTHTW